MADVKPTAPSDNNVEQGVMRESLKEAPTVSSAAVTPAPPAEGKPAPAPSAPPAEGKPPTEGKPAAEGKKEEKIPSLFPNQFARTSLEYWGKSTLDYNWYWILTVFLGFTGLDMLYLRSPIMMIVKIIVNIFTLGYWWAYDALEATFNSKHVKVAGPTAPFYGPLGIAGGMFMGLPGTPVDRAKHANFLVYSIILIFTGLFGGDSFLTGDNLSGYLRIFFLITIILAPISFLWWMYKIYQLYVRPDQTLDQNWEFFGAPEPDDAASKCPNALEVFTVWVVDTLGVVIEYIPILSQFAPAIKALAQSLRVAYGFVKKVAQTAYGVTKIGKQAIDSGVMDVDQVETEKIRSEQSNSQPVKGGGQESSAYGALFLSASIAFVIFSSLSTTIWRTYQKWTNAAKTTTYKPTDAEANQPGSERSDDPPQPTRSRKNASK